MTDPRWWLLAGLATALATPVQAQEREDDGTRVVEALLLRDGRRTARRGDMSEVHRSPHTENTRFILGLKGAQLTAFINGREQEEGELVPVPSPQAAGGVQAFFETTLVEGVAELELGFSTFIFADETELPFDVLLKKPFCLNHVVQMYLGIGGTVSTVIDRQGNTDVGGGGIFAFGTYLWVTENFGFDLEADYALIGVAGDTVHELTLGFGPALRI
ncbi:MAG: hypothetical protein ACFCGT_11950 [Sandaracinaceae bacterium]